MALDFKTGQARKVKRSHGFADLIPQDSIQRAKIIAES
jgi:hypothetical protein